MVKNMQDVYLYRKDRRWQKASKVIEVTMTSNQTAYAGITGVASTNIVTVTGATLADGQILTLSAKTGGSGLSLGVGYYIINASGAAGQLSLTPGGSVVALGTNITAPSSGIVSQPELSVWSSEYRDTFNYSNGLLQQASTYNSGGPSPEDVTTNTRPANISNSEGITLIPKGPVTIAQSESTFRGTITNTGPFQSVAGFDVSITDEMAHAPLRQTFLKKSFWKFDRGGSIAPRYLYAEYMQGDQILDNPPETL
jgi:hypothetical protein